MCLITNLCIHLALNFDIIAVNTNVLMNQIFYMICNYLISSKYY